MNCKGFKPDFPTEIIEEGKVRVLVPQLKAFVKQPSEYAPSKAPVFYNPVMELNRDLAVLALQTHQKRIGREIDVCEPLTGCGLRGLRFAVEVEGVRKTIINDINENAFRLARHNVEMNNMAKRVTVKNKEANLLLNCYSAPQKRFDAVDIDPFGSPIPFLDSAVRALRDNGLIALTATDMASLSGVHPRACLRKYGGRPLRTEYCHELGVRLLIGALTTTAAKHDLAMSVVFSHRGQHYIRVYATLKYGARVADESMKNMGFILHCFNCFHRETVKDLFRIGQTRKCSHCGSRLSFAGPLFTGGLLDISFCNTMEQEARKRRFKLGHRIRRMLALAKSEIDAPSTYFVIDEICDAFNLPVPPVKSVLNALENEGFRATLTHFSSTGIRSNVPARRLGEILRDLTSTTANST